MIIQIVILKHGKICSPQTKQMALPLTSVNEYLAVYVLLKTLHSASIYLFFFSVSRSLLGLENTLLINVSSIASTVRLQMHECKENLQ